MTYKQLIDFLWETARTGPVKMRQFKIPKDEYNELIQDLDREGVGYSITTAGLIYLHTEFGPVFLFTEKGQEI